MTRRNIIVGNSNPVMMQNIVSVMSLMFEREDIFEIKITQSNAAALRELMLQKGKKIIFVEGRYYYEGIIYLEAMLRKVFNGIIVFQTDQDIKTTNPDYFIIS